LHDTQLVPSCTRHMHVANGIHVHHHKQCGGNIRNVSETNARTGMPGQQHLYPPKLDTTPHAVHELGSCAHLSCIRTCPVQQMCTAWMQRQPHACAHRTAAMTTSCMCAPHSHSVRGWVRLPHAAPHAANAGNTGNPGNAGNSALHSSQPRHHEPRLTAVRPSSHLCIHTSAPATAACMPQSSASAYACLRAAHPAGLQACCAARGRGPSGRQTPESLRSYPSH
jgi:hypothetical protein